MARRTDQPRNLEGDLPTTAPEVHTTHPGPNANPGQEISRIWPPRSGEDPQPVVTLATTTDHIPLQNVDPTAAFGPSKAAPERPTSPAIVDERPSVQRTSDGAIERIRPPRGCGPRWGCAGDDSRAERRSKLRHAHQTKEHKLSLPEVVSREEWLVARKELLVQEKELTRARDRLNADRRRLPMVRVDKQYIFEGPDGQVGLLDLFEGRRQLVVHHFMWTYDIDEDGMEHPREVGCPSCSATADAIGDLTHLHVRNTTLAAASRAPYANIAAFRQRMGWTFPWYSSAGSDFNYDFHATLDDRVATVLFNFRGETELERAGNPWSPQMRGDWPGISAFLRDGDTVYHTYSTFARGIDLAGSTGYYLDLTALGRQEAWEEPKGRTTALGMHAGGPELRFHDEYGPDDGA
jgi:predicted dithiol-disulfide oxidoreductase (DUF899 family)